MLAPVTGLELLAEHVERFNTGVRSGDFAAMVELFADDATLEFEGVPVGPFHGREAIAAAYREQPPDDEIEVLEASEEGDEVVARYAWSRDERRAAGDLRLTRDGDRIARLVVTFDAASLGRAGRRGRSRTVALPLDRDGCQRDRRPHDCRRCPASALAPRDAGVEQARHAPQARREPGQASEE